MDDRQRLLLERERLLLEEEEANSVPQRQSTTEVAMRGAGQGLFGLGDELEATYKNPMGGIKKLGSRIGLADAADPEVMDYMMKLQEARDANNQAAEQNPLVYRGAELGTGAATMIGGGLPGLAAKGALAAYGASQSDSGAAQLGEAALGAGLGAGVGKVVNLGGEVVAPAVKAAGGILEKTTPGMAKSAIQTGMTSIGGAVGGVPGAAVGYAGRKLIPNSTATAAAAFARNAGEATTELGRKLAEKGFSGPVADRIAQTAAGEMLVNAAPERVMPEHYVLYNTDENYRKAVNGDE